MRIICIDPGHGGTGAKLGGSSPNNATGPNGLLEKQVTLDVAQRLDLELSACNDVQTVMTRTTDTNLSLADRADVARQAGADVFLSIHFNAPEKATDHTTNGTETWVWPKGNASSARLGREVQQALVNELKLRDRGVKTGRMGVLNPARHDPNTACCLAEVSFLTNTDEEQRLGTDAYKDRIAKALATGIGNFLGIPCPVPARVLPPGDYPTPPTDRAYAGESFSEEREAIDVWHEVPLVPQQTGMSCWAAAAAMIVGWRDAIPVEPVEVAQAAGRWREYREGLQPKDVPTLARAWRLRLERARIDEPRDLVRLLKARGPLWVGEASPGLHSVVVTGLQGDGTLDGTKVRVADPWPMECGERYSISFREFLANLHATDLDEGPQILSSGGRGAGARGEAHLRESLHVSYGAPDGGRRNPDAYPAA